MSPLPRWRSGRWCAVGLALLAWSACAPALAAPGDSRAFGLIIRVEGDGWGKAGREEIEALLYAVADELVSRPDPVFDHPIVVTHAPGNPVALYRRGPRGEYLVRLSARDRRWAQFAYQFGHELCHVMSNYGVRAGGGTARRNQWFEEALCETAALFALRAMSRTWRRAAPFPGWEDYAPELRAYAERLASEPHRRLPEGWGAGRWLEAHLERMARDPYRRQDNEVVAGLMLPLFEEDPGRWAALYALNRHPGDADAELPRYLRHWYRNAAPDHRRFIGELALRLGLPEALPAPDEMLDAPPGPMPAAQAGSAGPIP